HLASSPAAPASTAQHALDRVAYPSHTATGGDTRTSPLGYPGRSSSAGERQQRNHNLNFSHRTFRYRVSRKPPLNETPPFSHNTIRSDCIIGFGLLTVPRVRDIRSASWRPSLKTPAGMGLSGHNDM